MYKRLTASSDNPVYLTVGKTEGFKRVEQLLKGRKTSLLGTLKYNHTLLYCAVREYALESEESGRETKFIQLFGTFMGNSVVDYVEKVKKSADKYEEYMQREYGNEWRSIKFVYK